MVSGCNIVQGCEKEDEQTGVARPYAFRLKLNSMFNKSNVPVSSISSDGSSMQMEEMESMQSRYLCLAADSENSLNKWINTVSISSQIPDKVTCLKKIPTSIILKKYNIYCIRSNIKLH